MHIPFTLLLTVENQVTGPTYYSVTLENYVTGQTFYSVTNCGELELELELYPVINCGEVGQWIYILPLICRELGHRTHFLPCYQLWRTRSPDIPFTLLLTVETYFIGRSFYPIIKNQVENQVIGLFSFVYFCCCFVCLLCCITVGDRVTAWTLVFLCCHELRMACRLSQ